MQVSPPISVYALVRLLSISSKRGFSMLELLVVIGIIGILTVLAIPAVRSIGDARGVTNAAVGVIGALELARSEAVARQTYVWAAFQGSNEGGGSNVMVALMSSIDGSANPEPPNLRAIAKPLLFRQVELVPATSTGLPNLPEGIENLGTNGIAFTVGSKDFSARQTITFSPQGDAMLEGSPSILDGFEPWIGIGLRAPTQSENVAAILVDGSVGVPGIVRIE